MVRSDGVYETLTVPPGFQTDLATIPIFAQVFIGGRDDPGVGECAVAHDYMTINNLPREFCNTKMWHLMLALNVPRWRATAIYLALMMFGYKSPVSRLVKRIHGFFNMET
jgi:hypothetical protein